VEEVGLTVLVAVVVAVVVVTAVAVAAVAAVAAAVVVAAEIAVVERATFRRFTMVEKIEQNILFLMPILSTYNNLVKIKKYKYLIN
jgi:hypothetical protein